MIIIRQRKRSGAETEVCNSLPALDIQIDIQTIFLDIQVDIQIDITSAYKSTYKSTYIQYCVCYFNIDIQIRDMLRAGWRRDDLDATLERV